MDRMEALDRDQPTAPSPSRQSYPRQGYKVDPSCCLWLVHLAKRVPDTHELSRPQYPVRLYTTGYSSEVMLVLPGQVSPRLT